MNKLILLAILIAFLVIILSKETKSSSHTFGVSFSPQYSGYLGLDFKKTYLYILDDLKVKNLRIPTFWSEVEKVEGKFNFDEVDFMVDEAGKRDTEVILVVGIKQPRWPECHIPEWARSLSIKDRQQKALQYAEKVVTRYSKSSNIVTWQVENEPYVAWFGENCDPPDKDFLEKEINLVRKLGLEKPIIVTDSGEWSFWQDASYAGDILGISAYRKAFNNKFGYISYPFPAWVYSTKAKILGKKTIIAELQAEPWPKSGIIETAIDEQTRLFSLNEFKNNVEFAKKTNFEESYLWGVEWWYYMAQNGHPQYLEYAKTLF